MEYSTISDMEIDGEEKIITHDSKIVLPPMNIEDEGANKKTLVLDLDNTLVHASYKHEIPNHTMYVPESRGGADYPLFVALRPGAVELIERLSSKYELVVFTAGSELHAKGMLDILDPKKVYFLESNVLHSRHCTITDIGGGRVVPVKDLGILGRDLSKVIIIDDRPHSAQFHPKNIVTVHPWKSCRPHEYADELTHVTGFLESVADLNEDVRRLIRRYPQPSHFHSHFSSYTHFLTSFLYGEEEDWRQ